MADHRRRARGKVAGVLSATVVAAMVVVPAPSRAGFPGVSGLIAYVNAAGDVFVVNPSNPVPVQITNAGGFATVAYNAAGNKLAAAGAAGLVLLDPVPGSTLTVVPNTTGGDAAPAFSPDGTKLAFSSPGGIFTIGVTGTNRTNIRSQGARPDWSPDGSFIAFDNNAGTQILRVGANGGGVTTLATTGAGGACAAATPCRDVSVSPDGSSVAFTRRVPAGGGGIARVNANGSSPPVQLSASTGAGNEDGSPSFAPDGTKLAFARGAISNGALSTVPADGSQTVTSVGNITTVMDVSWGTAPAATTFSVAGPSGRVKNGPCVFAVTASAPATGSVNFTATVVSSRNVPSPASGAVNFANQTSNTVSIDVKHGRRKHGDVSLTLTSATVGAVGSPASATCDVARK